MVKRRGIDKRKTLFLIFNVTNCILISKSANDIVTNNVMWVPFRKVSVAKKNPNYLNSAFMA